jgi:cell division protein FtsN
MSKLQLDIKSKAKDVFSAKVVATSADGKDITVDIKPIKDDKTKYTIQVGSFGNESRSRMIFTEIKNILMER